MWVSVSRVSVQPSPLQQGVAIKESMAQRAVEYESIKVAANV